MSRAAEEVSYKTVLGMCHRERKQRNSDAICNYEGDYDLELITS